MTTKDMHNNIQMDWLGLGIVVDNIMKIE